MSPRAIAEQITRTIALLGILGCGEGTPEAALSVEGEAPLAACDQLDGVVSPGELSFTPGLTVRYAVQKPHDALGGLIGDPATGQARWDFSQTDFDRLVDVTTRRVEGLWFADAAPDALILGFADAGGAESHLLLRPTERALEILGVASVTTNEQLFIYDAPIPFLRFPMDAQSAWRASASPAEGSLWLDYDLASAGIVDRYTVEVIGGGSLALPSMEIGDVLAISLTLSRQLRDQAPWIAQETYLIHECLGTVARRTEPDGPWWVVWYPR
ncbi:hypothetical protein KKF91_19995 [Myxococcota bacterium]|nr:hypothetical protein [Myxococcota bacterium]MBU1432828.1 hypothetical protein [Myxococcota bacterium]MBU1897546.1 hypothetical protein [Myxococcota bacterium]